MVAYLDQYKFYLALSQMVQGIPYRRAPENKLKQTTF